GGPRRRRRRAVRGAPNSNGRRRRQSGRISRSLGLKTISPWPGTSTVIRSTSGPVEGRRVRVSSTIVPVFPATRATPACSTRARRPGMQSLTSAIDVLLQRPPSRSRAKATLGKAGLAIRLEKGSDVGGGRCGRDEDSAGRKVTKQLYRGKLFRRLLARHLLHRRVYDSGLEAQDGYIGRS